jgi:hypothetical protein
MKNTMDRSQRTLSTLGFFMLAVVIDLPAALMFIYKVIDYRYQSNDVDVERFIFLSIIPSFNAINFIIIMTLYFMISKDYKRWPATIIISTFVFILSYPTLFLSSNITDLFDLKFPDDELYALQIFTISTWLIVTIIGSTLNISYILRRKKRLS